MTKIHDADHRVDADGTEHLRLTFTPHRGPHLTFTREDFDRMVRGHLARERVAYRRALVGITSWKVRRDLHDGWWAAPDENSRDRPYKFRTHLEAITYATRKARDQ
ncbi:MAG: hypothetical protein ACI38U_14190 [Corynebacterium sp.]|uniref:hypothetical protein n=1 Tax=Corynebacterium sp. TaxID=1720 RepID=UPI003F070F72